MVQLQGKKAIVTGGAMGIGLATVKRLLNEGCDVTIWDFNPDALRQAESELKAMNQGKVHAHECDVTDKERVKALTETAVNDMGCIDILINNAGIERHGRFHDVPLEVWEQESAINLNAIYYTTHAVLPKMYERNSGHIVNISSAAGLLGVADLAVYCATKWGVFGFTEALRIEAMQDKKKVCFTSIHPHFVKEGLFAGGHLNALGELLVPRISTHDVVAKMIVKKGLKKKRNTVKIPVTLQLGQTLRGLMPDKIFQVLSLYSFGTGKSMDDTVGYGE
jgi:all-trans-retinol dehydrogenase (NAD+)